jgi:ABC transporter DrrB family efflux protein
VLRAWQTGLFRPSGRCRLTRWAPRCERRCLSSSARFSGLRFASPPGIFVQTTVFGAIGTAIGLAADVKSGLLERFLSLPMARSAVLTGRTLADLGRNVFVVILMAGVGFAVGFRVESNAVRFVAAMLLVLAFGYALSWVFGTIGLLLRDPESAQAAAFPIMAPLVFASSAFVPVNSMPGWLQPFAEHQPVSVTASAARALTLGTPGHLLPDPDNHLDRRHPARLHSLGRLALPPRRLTTPPRPATVPGPQAVVISA